MPRKEEKQNTRIEQHKQHTLTHKCESGKRPKPLLTIKINPTGMGMGVGAKTHARPNNTNTSKRPSENQQQQKVVKCMYIYTCW